MFTFLMFLQNVGYTDKLVDALIATGPGGIMAAIIFYFYRQDRIASEIRFQELAKDFRAIVENNTAALEKTVTILGHVEHVVESCPIAREQK